MTSPSPLPQPVTAPEPPATVHLMGVCGTAMGAFAGMLKDLGYTITGSDQSVYPPMSDYLAGLGIRVMEGFEAHNLDHKPDLVVVGNVIRASYAEAQALLASGIPYTSMPDLLGSRFLERAHATVVAGTHGKTTTTAITAWLLERAGLRPGYLIGGVARNFERTARTGAGAHFVIEGDEYDTAFFDKRPKFVHYRPNTAILTSVEFDHADIYRDLDHVKEAFRTLVGLIPADGLLIARWDDPNVRDVARGAAARMIQYGRSQPWDGRVESVDTDRGTMTFSVLRDGKAIGTFTSIMVGEHNLYNQVAAAAAAIEVGATIPQLQDGFATFQGIKRRQEVIGEPGGVTVIDDFAHHPTAVDVTLAALRQRFGGRRLITVWEPRSATSRRAEFQEAYARSFDKADFVIVAAPYDQSRLGEGDRFSSARLVEDLAGRGVDAMTFESVDDIVAALVGRAHPHDVIAVFSNGGFGGLHQKLLTALHARFDTPSAA
jgi:UDP-N-acetylmuramate: L-alanyl-gamma-D-glutamyl-meso-diaminopimelate ligase